jgi:hypothetical protein
MDKNQEFCFPLSIHRFWSAAMEFFRFLNLINPPLFIQVQA